jgi:hypothetical protein
MPRVVTTTAAAAGAILSAAAALAGTSFTSTWKAPDAQPGRLAGQKVVSVIMTQDPSLRQGVEHQLALQLTRLGVQGVAAYTIVPASQMKDEAAVRAKLEEQGVQAAVVMRLVGTDQTLNAAPAMYYAGPSYSTFYGGYVKMDRILHVETLIYSLRQNKLVWAAQLKLTNPTDVKKAMAEMVDKVAGELKSQKLLR